MASETATASQLQLRFKRNDITSVGRTHRDTLKALPAAKARTRQKLVVGDCTGVATCFGVGKHHELKPEFSTPKPDNNAELTSLSLYKDQIFLGLGSRIVAYTKKGKPFYINETNVSEPILHMDINTPFQTIAGDYTLTHFREVNDVGFFMSPDKINGFITVQRDAEGTIDVYIAGQDRTVRCVRKTEMRQQMGCEAPVTCIAWNHKSDVKALENPMVGLDLVYGTLGGSIGGLRAAPDGFARRFSAVPPSKLASVTCIACADLTLGGINDVVVARDDGSIELHSFEQNPDGTPVTAWKGNVSELVTSLDTGAITHSDRHDLVLSTYSGKVITFSVGEEDASSRAVIPQVLQSAQPELQTAEASASQYRQSMSSSQPAENATEGDVLKAKMNEAMNQIADLKRDLQKKKNEYAGADPGAKKVPAEKVRALASTFTLREKIQLEDSGTVVLGVELDTVLESVALQSLVAFEVVQDANSNDETRVSITDPAMSPQSKAKLLAVYRTQQESAQTRLEMRLRPTEGQSGEIVVYVTPRTNPKSVLKRIFDIPPLSLHQRVAEESSAGSDPAADPTLSYVNLTGNFSIKDAHAWIYRAFFDVPQNVVGEEMRLTFRNTFSGSMLYIRYRRGDFTASSHNLSALAMLRDFIAREAARRKIQLQMDVRPNAQSLNVMLEQLDPHVAKEARLARAVKILDALKEIQSQENDVTFLTQEYREILTDADNITKAHASQPKRLQYVLTILERLLHDRASFRDGAAANAQRVAELHALVNNNYSLDAIQRFFASA
jgi:Bardet-Biedl syndrome 7 protein